MPSLPFEIHGECNRRGPLLVFLPGLFAGAWLWRKQLASVTAAGYQALAFKDAFIRADKKICEVEQLAELCAETLQPELDRGIVVIGNSIGGLIALMLARKLPQAANAVLASGVPGLGGDVNLGIGTRDMLSREYAQKIADQVFYNRALVSDAEIDAVFREVDSPHSLLQMTRILRSARHLSVPGIVTEIRQPTFLLWGKHDRITPAAPWQEMAGKLPANFTFHAISDAGHCPMIERPDEFNPLLLHYLQKLASQASASVN
jgi:2-hydroxy-6-oxonona-2,4-dienedioate hydrolase